MESRNKAKWVAVIVAHPDDETLWAGGTILSQPSWSWFILSLCRGSDPDRAPKFSQALKALGAEGKIVDLDDGPEQNPLAKREIEDAILRCLPRRHFDLIISHNPAGEYTRHRRHEEVGAAVISLWDSQKIRANKLWTFAYEDGGKQYYPQPIKTAHMYLALPEDIWQKKYSLITQTYGFPKDGFEARTTPRAEAFWHFACSNDAREWLTNQVFQHESIIAL
jgi:LmbE family N-acetylglucosaminyl deacetylase